MLHSIGKGRRLLKILSQDSPADAPMPCVVGDRKSGLLLVGALQPGKE